MVYVNQLSCLTAEATFSNLILFVIRDAAITGDGGINIAGPYINIGSTRLFSAPGTNRPTLALVDQLKVQSGTFALDNNAMVISLGKLQTNGEIVSPELCRYLS